MRIDSHYNQNRTIITGGTGINKYQAKSLHNRGNVSFGMASILSFPQFMMDFVARGGLWATFCIQDFLGMVFPRICAGFSRNKDITGEYNYGEAAEVAIREILTGPPMFLIPMILISNFKKYIGQACDVPVEFIKAFGSVSSKIMNGTEIKKDDLYNTIIRNVLGTATNNELSPATLDKTIDTFVKNIKIIEKSKPRTLRQKLKDEKIEWTSDYRLSELEGKFIKLKKEHTNVPSDDFLTAVLNVDNEKLSCSFDKLLSHMRNFTEDILKYCKKHNFTQDTVSKFVQKRCKARKGAIVTMLACVMGFCYKIPDLYQLHEINPGLSGLVTDFDSQYNQLIAQMSGTNCGPVFSKTQQTWSSPFENTESSSFWLMNKRRNDVDEN